MNAWVRMLLVGIVAAAIYNKFVAGKVPVIG